MGDLEESIFQRNVPGKYSRWDLEEKREEIRDDCEKVEIDSETHDEDAALLRYAEQLSQAEVPETIRNRILAERASAPSTGVKGVLADYRAAQAYAVAEGEAEAIARQQIITRMVEGAKVKTTAEQTIEELVAEAQLGGEGEDSDGFGDDHDDAFMREFRARRLQEIKAANTQALRAAPMFGTVREIRSEEFLGEIDGEDPRVLVVVHLYEPAVQGCLRMNSLLDQLAATMPGVKFLRLQASSNEIEVDRVALPILTLYRAGQEADTLAGIAADFGPYFTVEDITWLLQTSPAYK